MVAATSALDLDEGMEAEASPTPLLSGLEVQDESATVQRKRSQTMPTALPALVSLMGRLYA